MTRRSTTQTQSKSSFTPVQTGLLRRKCTSCGQHKIAGEECPKCQKQQTILQRSAVNQAEQSEVPLIVDEVLRSPGQPLDVETRTFMEPLLGHDFSQVRVHTDVSAERSARSLNAQAYTMHKDIVFAPEQYAPRTTAGKRLLAHELTHTVQQSNHPTSVSPQQLGISNPSDPAETEAEEVAQQVLNGSGVHSAIHQSPARLQRQLASKAPDSVTLSSGLSINAQLFAQMMAMCAQGKLDPIQCIKMQQAAGLLTDPTATPSSRFGMKPMELGDRSSNKLPSMAEIRKILDESNRALGALGVGKPIPPPPGWQLTPNATAQPAPATTSSSPSLEDLLSFKFQAGPFKAEVELPKSVKLKLPVALTKAKTLTFEIQAESSKTFSAAIRLDGLLHLNFALKAQMNVDKDKGNSGSAGLEIQTTRTVCSADNPESLKAKIMQSGEKLTKGMKELETAPADERLEKLVDIAGAIGEMYDAIDKSKKGCKDVPSATFNFGLQGPLSEPSSPDKLDPDPLKRPTPFLGVSLTIPF